MRAIESGARNNGWGYVVSDTTDNVASANNFIRAGYRLYEPRHPWGWPNTFGESQSDNEVVVCRCDRLNAPAHGKSVQKPFISLGGLGHRAFCVSERTYAAVLSRPF
jgi:hypothetical protein